MIDILKSEDTYVSRRKQGKRSLAISETCKIELAKEIQLLFQTFEEALDKSYKIMGSFPQQSRSRNLEASVVQSVFGEILLNNFNEKALFGKYRRLILRVKGYLILFKKLNNKGYPMNIKTINVQSILNQNQVIDLFRDTDYNDEPILYFGYQKNKFGQYINPQLIYIDEGNIKFSIVENDIVVQKTLPIIVSENKLQEVKPVLKKNLQTKKAQ